MADARSRLVPGTLTRLLDELLWRLRRDGLAISTAQAIDAARAVEAVGIADPFAVREAVACVVVVRAGDRAAFDAAFDAFFAAARDGEGRDARLLTQGFAPDELRVLRQLLADAAESDADLAALAGLLTGGADVDARIARAGLYGAIDAGSEPQLGFHTHHLLRALSVDRARAALARLRDLLVAALGERGESLARAAAAELEREDSGLRAYVRRLYESRVAERERVERGGGALDLPLASLDEERSQRVLRALRAFAEGLRGSARVRRRRARRGRIDAHRTWRRSLRTGGVPFTLIRRRAHRERPRIVVLCDVSESVRSVARFMLEVTAATHQLFEHARTFVFVSDLGETTDLFARGRARTALDAAWRGAGLIRTDENSNYGRVLRSFERRVLRDLDRRTTVVILGDGRSNYHDTAPDVLDRLRARVRALVWLCPEPRSRWSIGDSAMSRYAPRCTAVHEVRTAADLECAARRLVRGSRSG
jgi:uncharacterized protein